MKFWLQTWLTVWLLHRQFHDRRIWSVAWSQGRKPKPQPQLHPKKLQLIIASWTKNEVCTSCHENQCGTPLLLVWSIQFARSTTSGSTGCFRCNPCMCCVGVPNLWLGACYHPGRPDSDLIEAKLYHHTKWWGKCVWSFEVWFDAFSV